MPAESEPYTRVVVDLDDILVQVRRALVARYGPDIGADCTSEAARWAVENAARLATMHNPAGYLYRVGQTEARRLLRWHRRTVSFPAEPTWDDSPPFDDDLFDALKRLRPNHRTAVLLVHGYGFSYGEVADLLDVAETAVTNYVHRGLKQLRALMEADR